MGECSYGDMVVSTLWWHLFMLVPLSIRMKGYTMRWQRNGTRWIRNSRHDVTQDSNFTWWPLPATWYSGRLDARSGWFDAGFGSYYYADDHNHKRCMEFFKRFNGNKIYILITPEYSRWTREFYVWRILILGKPVNFAGNYFDSWINKVSTQWLSWTHVPIVSRGHYEIMRLQDYPRLKETLASARFWDRVKSQMNGLWWYYLVWLSISICFQFVELNMIE